MPYSSSLTSPPPRGGHAPRPIREARARSRGPDVPTTGRLRGFVGILKIAGRRADRYSPCGGSRDGTRTYNLPSVA
jgi:hypothetical protein